MSRLQLQVALSNARELLNKVKNGEADYQFIEIMGRPGGCVNGGGSATTACEHQKLY